MIRVTTIWGGTGQGLPYYSTHYFGGTTEGEADAAVAAVSEFWQACSTITDTGLAPVIQPEVEVVDVASGQVTGVFITEPDQPDMTASGDTLPWATQGLIRWRTGVFEAGREIRGRTFLPGMMEANNVLGVPASSWVTLANTAASTMLTESTGAGGLVVYSRTHGQDALVSVGSAWNQWASVRSRRD